MLLLSMTLSTSFVQAKGNEILLSLPNKNHIYYVNQVDSEEEGKKHSICYNLFSCLIVFFFF